MRHVALLLVLLLASVSLYAQTTAQKALNAEPEMKQLRGLTDEARARQQLPADQKPGALYSAGQSALTLQQQRHLMDVLEERLETQAASCHYCSSIQAELSELIRQRAQAESAFGAVIAGSGLNASGSAFLGAVMGIAPTEDRWKDRKIAEKQVDNVIAGCIIGHRSADNKVIPICTELNQRSRTEVAELHEVTWAKCFSSHNWVNTPSERASYESCMDADDPLMKICHAERRADCLYSRVTAIDVAPLTNYKNRWGEPAKSPAELAQIRASERALARLKPGSNLGICNRTDSLISVAFNYMDPAETTLFHNEGGNLLGKNACKVFSIGASTLGYVSLLRAQNEGFVAIKAPLHRGVGVVEENPPRSFCAKPDSKFSVVGTESKLAQCGPGFFVQEYPYRWSAGDRAPAEGKYGEFTIVVFPDGPEGTVGNYPGWDEDYVPTAADLKHGGVVAVATPVPPEPHSGVRAASMPGASSSASPVARASAPAQLPAVQLGDLAGSYSGTYTCGIEKTPLQLTVTVDANSVMRAVFAASIPGLPPYDLAGNFFPGQNEFYLNAVRWEGRPLPGYRMVGMRGKVEPGDLTLRGKITDPRCGEFLLQRMHLKTD